jgi:hypothetical protein
VAELATAELKGPLDRRKLENLIQNIGTQVAERLEPVLSARFSSLPENEITAAAFSPGGGHPRQGQSLGRSPARR